MVGPRKYSEILKEEGSFDGVKFPALKGVVVELKSTQQVEKATKDNSIIKTYDPDFKITLDFRQYNNRQEDKELSEKIRLASGLNFVPYYSGTGVYSFYTRGFTPLEQKKEIFQKIIDVASEYVKDKKLEIKEFSKDFKADYEDSVLTESKTMMLMPYSVADVKPLYLLVLKDRVDDTTYRFFKRESSYAGYLSAEKEDRANRTISASLFDVNKYYPEFKRKAAFFLFNEMAYMEIKTFVKAEVAKDSFYYEEQVRKAGGNENLKDVEVLEENIFGIRIEYLEDKGVYLFNGKGYKDSEGFTSSRTLLGLWANNMIYSEPLNGNDYVYSNEFFMENSNKIKLDFLRGGSAKKGFEVPLSFKSKLGIIKENLEKELKVWGRETVMIDFLKPVDIKYQWDKPYPVVYINSLGDAYLCYSLREKNKVVEDGDMTYKTLVSSTLKAIPISREEVNYFMNEHPLSDKIAPMSKKLTVMGTDAIKVRTDFEKLSASEEKDIYDTIMLHYNMKQDNKQLEQTPRVKAKKF